MAFEYFNDRQVADLVAKLIEITESGRLSWSSPDQESGSPASQYLFTSITETFGFRLESKDEDDLAPHLLTVFEKAGRDVRALQTIDSTYTSPDVGESLERLYNSVKRKTMKTDVLANKVLDELDRIADEPPF